MNFDDLRLSEPLCRAVAELGYSAPTPIQQQAIPYVLDGRDLLGIAQTGTGKTAAFALPLLQRLGAPLQGRRSVRVLVLAPTRELASQIGESFDALGAHTGLTSLVIFGGVGHAPQRQALKRGADVLVATPGRLLDLAGEGILDLRALQAFVLDEADRMLDMGFVHDVKRVIALLPPKRQTLLFSATMPGAVQELSRGLLRDPARVEVTPVSSTAERVKQHVLFVDKAQKRHLLTRLVARPAVTRAIVFTRTKHGANRVAEHLEAEGIRARAIHGNKSQGAREAPLGGFRDGTVRVLVATDIAARGIDVDDVSHVINFDLPNVPEQYVHRIGRTARAGRGGVALSFCDVEERPYLRDIEKLIATSIPVYENHPFPAQVTTPPPSTPKPTRTGRGRGRGGRPR